MLYDEVVPKSLHKKTGLNSLMDRDSKPLPPKYSRESSLTIVQMRGLLSSGEEVNDIKERVKQDLSEAQSCGDYILIKILEIVFSEDELEEDVNNYDVLLNLMALHARITTTSAIKRTMPLVDSSEIFSSSTKLTDPYFDDETSQHIFGMLWGSIFTIAQTLVQDPPELRKLYNKRIIQFINNLVRHLIEKYQRINNANPEIQLEIDIDFTARMRNLISKIKEFESLLEPLPVQVVEQ